MDVIQLAIGGASGALVGFTLGLVGGGGSVLAVLLIVYVVDVSHIAIGTSAIAVSANPSRVFFITPASGP